MSPAAFAIVLVGALGLLALVVNHCAARIALVELALNEGLPPGHAAAVATPAAPGPARAGLEPGVHVFLSRNCHACQRLVEELAGGEFSVHGPVFLRYVDRPRPIAATAASNLGASLVEQQAGLAATVGADPLPFTIGIGDHGLVHGQVTPTAGDVRAAARHVGIRVRPASTGTTA